MRDRGLPFIRSLWRTTAVPIGGLIIFTVAATEWLLLFSLPRLALASFIAFIWFGGALAGIMLERAATRRTREEGPGPGASPWDPVEGKRVESAQGGREEGTE